jgi:hypothetical protein
VQFVIKYISPLFLLAILIGNILKFGPGYWKTLTTNPVAGLSFGFIVLITIFFFVLVHIAGRRWQAERRFAASNTDSGL